MSRVLTRFQASPRQRYPPDGGGLHQMSFIATHVVPDSGLNAWERPDPTLHPVAPLDPRLPVIVFERTGDWAHIRCSNGWEAWTDGRALDEAVASAPGKLATPDDTALLQTDARTDAGSHDRRKVGDVVKRGEVTVLYAWTPLDQAAKVFDHLGARVLPIWNGEGVIGMLPRERLTDELARTAHASQTVADLACATHFCFDDDNLEAVLEVMRQKNFTDIVVLDRANAMVGMLSSDGHPPAMR
jgi:hypothetical protein